MTPREEYTVKVKQLLELTQREVGYLATDMVNAFTYIKGGTKSQQDFYLNAGDWEWCIEQEKMLSILQETIKKAHYDHR